MINHRKHSCFYRFLILSSQRREIQDSGGKYKEKKYKPLKHDWNVKIVLQFPPESQACFVTCFQQAGHFPTNGRNSPTWDNFTLCRRKYILPRREKMSMFASVFTVAEKSHFDNSSTFKTNQYSIYVCLYQHPKGLQLVRISLQRFITRTFAMGCTILEVNFDK